MGCGISDHYQKKRGIFFETSYLLLFSNASIKKAALRFFKIIHPPELLTTPTTVK
jgi:hypothetical protein